MTSGRGVISCDRSSKAQYIFIVMFAEATGHLSLQTLLVFSERDISSDVISVEPDTPLPTDTTDWKLPIESVGEAKLIHTT